MAEIRDWLEQEEVRVAVISFAEPARLQAYQEMKRWPFPILADPGRSAYRALGLSRLPWRKLFNWRTIRAYLRLLARGAKRDPYQPDDFQQSGGDFLLDRRGVILFAHRGADPADRPPVETLRRIVRETRPSAAGAPDDEAS